MLSMCKVVYIGTTNPNCTQIGIDWYDYRKVVRLLWVGKYLESFGEEPEKDWVWGDTLMGNNGIESTYRSTYFLQVISVAFRIY